MIRYFLLCVLFINGVLLSQNEDDNPILVQLSSEAPLLPIYIAPIEDESSSLSKCYLALLEQVLAFDMNHNGMTCTAKNSHQKEALARSFQQDCSDLSPWMDQQVYFAILTTICDKKLSAHLLMVNSNSFKRIDGIMLSGNINEDRKTIHLLSDRIHKTLFEEDGIATTRILYTVKKQDPTSKKWNAEVFEADYDGGNPRQVTHTGSYSVTPAYLPPKPGKRSGNFVFVSYQIGQPKIFFGNLRSGDLQRFSLLKGNQLMPAISRQRDQIAFICDVTGNPDLFLQGFDPDKGLIGKPRQIFTTHRATQGTPSFSPDGKKIAFVSNKDGSPRIYIIKIPPVGTPLKEIKAELITKISRENTAPCWSPDGKRIAFCAMTKGVRQIWIYDLEEKREKQITYGAGNKENPAWAPNSLHLIFNSSDAGASELYLTHIQHPKAIHIPVGNGEKHFPCWEIKQ